MREQQQGKAYLFPPSIRNDVTALVSEDPKGNRGYRLFLLSRLSSISLRSDAHLTNFLKRSHHTLLIRIVGKSYYHVFELTTYNLTEVGVLDKAERLARKIIQRYMIQAFSDAGALMKSLFRTESIGLESIGMMMVLIFKLRKRRDFK